MLYIVGEVRRFTFSQVAGSIDTSTFRKLVPTMTTESNRALRKYQFTLCDVRCPSACSVGRGACARCSLSVVVSVKLRPASRVEELVMFSSDAQAQLEACPPPG